MGSVAQVRHADAQHCEAGERTNPPAGQEGTFDKEAVEARVHGEEVAWEGHGDVVL
jgi:hypothetical protein